MPRPAPDIPAPKTMQQGSVTIRAMLVGAPKAGTTSLYRYAVQHPSLLGHPQRELSYFFSDDEFQHGYDAATAKYFPELTAEQAVLLAKHVFTMYSPSAITRLKEHNPAIHVFALLRDPVRRAYSSYWYARRRGWDTANSFEQALQWEADQTISDDWLINRDRLHLHVGIYHPHIKHLLDTFGKDHVHILLTDDLATDAATLCRSIYQATGVDPAFTPDLAQDHNTASAARSEPAARALAGVLKSKNPLKRAIRKLIPHSLARRARHTLLTLNEKPFTPPPMNPATQRKLIDHFAPHNERLAQLIGRDLGAWNRKGQA